MTKGRGNARFTPQRIDPQGYSIWDFFTDEEVEGLAWQARRYIIGAFHHATEYHNGKKKGTDNFIRGVQPKVSELGRHVLMRSTHKPFIKPHQLDELIDVRCASKGELDRLVHHLMYEVIMVALNMMCVKPPKTPSSFIPDKCLDEIWYDPVRCYWQIVQSSVDEYRYFQRNFRRMKQDNRNYHGRNRPQSRRRGTPGGTSIGLA